MISFLLVASDESFQQDAIFPNQAVVLTPLKLW